jgi:hypothetical protein
MSAGNFMGTIFVAVMATAMWLVLAMAIEKVALVFNKVLTIAPTFQDAINWFQITQTIWSFLLIVIWIVIWFNYAQNEASEAGGYV